MSLKQVVILVGGLGTRLGKITKKVPKPLIKINGKKFLDILINNFVRYKFSKIILLTGYKFSKFKKSYHKKKIESTEITCLNEKKQMGTGGAVINSVSLLDDYFLLCNGDTFLNINYYDFFIRSNKKKVLNVAITKKNRNKRFSQLKLKKNLIVDFNSENGNFTNTGYYIINKKKFIRQNFENKKSSLEQKIFPKLIKKKECSYVKYDQSFLDIGIKKDLINSSKFIENKSKRKFAILDRDGVINYDYGYVHKKKDFKLKPKIIEFIKLLNDNNFYVFVVSNQSGIGRGYYSENSVNKLHQYLNDKLIENGAHIDSFFISPYYRFSKYQKFRKGVNLRKPNIGLFKIIEKNYQIKLNGSFMVGDQISDLNFAKRINIKYFDINRYKDILSIRRFIKF